MIKLFEHYILGEKVYNLVVEPVCKKYNITHMEFKIIMFLYNNPSYNTAALICKYKKLVKSHVSISIKSLIDKHLLKKGFEGDNKKTIHLYLTEYSEVIARAGKLKQDEFKDIVLKDFKDDEVERLLSYIDRIDINLKSYE